MSANLVLPWATSSYPAGRELEQQEFRVRQVDRWSTLDHHTASSFGKVPTPALSPASGPAQLHLTANPLVLARSLPPQTDHLPSLPGTLCREASWRQMKMETKSEVSTSVSLGLQPSGPARRTTEKCRREWDPMITDPSRTFSVCHF